jgi:hypothetical protein
VSRREGRWLERAAVSLGVGAVVALSGGGLPATAADAAKPPIQYLTCTVTGDSFVMDDADFNALANPEARGANPPLTRQFFTSLKSTSVLREQICDSRGLLRGIRRLGPDHCTNRFLKGFPRWLLQFFTEAEQKTLVDCQINDATE